MIKNLSLFLLASLFLPTAWGADFKIAQLDIQGFNESQLIDYLGKIYIFKNDHSIEGLLISIVSQNNDADQIIFNLIEEHDTTILFPPGLRPTFKDQTISLLHQAISSFGKPVVILVDYFCKDNINLCGDNNFDKMILKVLAEYAEENEDATLEDWTKIINITILDTTNASMSDTRNILLTLIHVKNPTLLTSSYSYPWWFLLNRFEVVK